MRQKTRWLPLAALFTGVVANDKIDAVREVFKRSWDGYRKYAWGHDSLRPITNSFFDDRNGWGASAVDALSTAIIMGEEEAVKDILEFIPTIDFSTTTTQVSLFESTIRYLGGLLSGYDLLQGPYKELAPSKEAVDSLLEQAIRLADLLKVAFDTPSGVPDNDLAFDPDPRRIGTADNWIATVGTLVLEWERLSDITGNAEYGELAKKGESYLLDPQPPEAEPFPGMVGSRVWVENGTFVDAMGGWNGGTDSFYEYLIKMYVYDPVRFESYKDRWVLAADSSMEYLASHPTTRPDLTFLAMYLGQTRYFYSGHLSCFHGGNFILGGTALNEPRYIDFGLELTAGCRESYVQTTTGIGPELFQWQDNATALDAANNQPPPEQQVDFYEKAGFWLVNSQYSLRPEVIESYYYAYRATGDDMYRKWAWDAFVKINNTCSVGSGLSSIYDVQLVDGVTMFYDFQESFWFSEVLKYVYLILVDEDSEVQVRKSGRDLWVYNTEAHPLRVFDGSSTEAEDGWIED
ncbi:hypothetical protein jhhlp_000209 [Lomentospora prolificans]|uniref:alpha-1,2-Mannosidase n=1 Tax=Lomentospora prolificans TaxID=41688 RepID=A0A2N3NK99_9PEZI|nr:hypothetical protein jhhlp_000209 [Lomentospora prolificans]